MSVAVNNAFQDHVVFYFVTMMTLIHLFCCQWTFRLFIGLSLLENTAPNVLGIYLTGLTSLWHTPGSGTMGSRVCVSLTLMGDAKRVSKCRRCTSEA